jgi:hypothetical protein
MGVFDYWPFRSSPSATILLGSVGLAFFGALLVHSILRRDHRSYMPGLLLICAGCGSELVRGLIGSGLSPHPASIGGNWRLLTAAVLIAGAILFERARRRSLSNP